VNYLTDICRWAVYSAGFAPKQESPKPGRCLSPAVGSPKTATAEGLTGPWAHDTVLTPLPSFAGGGIPLLHVPSRLSSQAASSQPAAQGLAGPFPAQILHNSRLMQYPGFIFHPFPCFLTDLDLLQPLPGAPKRSSFEERPCASSLPGTPSHAPRSLVGSQSVEQPAEPLHKPSWMKKSLAV